MGLPLSLSGSSNSIVYATNVASALSQSYLYDPSVAMQSDPLIYEKLLLDCTIAGAYDHLQRSIVGHDFSFEPRDHKDKRHRQLATILEDLTRETACLPQTFYNLSRATFMGATWGLMVPERRLLAIGDGKLRWWTVISHVRDIDKRRFRLERLGATPTQAGDLYGSLQSDPRYDSLGQRTPAASEQPLEGGAQTRGAVTQGQNSWQWTFHRGPNFWWQPLAACAPTDRWIQHVPDTSERGLAFGHGQADELYEFFWSKQQVLRFGLQGLERWGQGFLYASIKALRDKLAKGQSQAGALNATLAQMRIWRSENMAAVDSDTELKLLDMPATANAQCLTWVEYLDRELVKRILSALQPTGGGDGSGSYSSSKTEEGSTDNTVAYLRSPLEETWTRTVARFLVEHNQDNLAELGLERLRASRLRLKGKEVRDLETMIKVFDLCARLKIPVRASDVYEGLQLTPPNGDEEDGDIMTFAAPVMGLGQDDMTQDVDLGGAGEDREPVGSGGGAVGDRRNGTARSVA